MPKGLIDGLRTLFRGESPPVPVFFITRDRVNVLRETIKSLAPLEDEVQVVVHDNESSFPPMLEYMQELEGQGVKVYRCKHTGSLDDISESVADTVERWFKETRSRARHYVVSDPDIELDRPPEDFIKMYQALLRKFPDAAVVGPMLRIDDLPDCYPLKERVIEGHTEQFWHKEPTTVSVLGRRIQIQQAPIDTTFGMYRVGFRFKRLNMGVRVYAPYAARHLDWYIDPDNMGEDQLYYMKSASEVAHWSAGWLKEKLEEE